MPDNGHNLRTQVEALARVVANLAASQEKMHEEQKFLLQSQVFITEGMRKIQTAMDKMQTVMDKMQTAVDEMHTAMSAMARNVGSIAVAQQQAFAAIQELTIRQERTDERLNILITIVDGIIRGRIPPPEPA